jgi:hypothetical protein
MPRCYYRLQGIKTHDQTTRRYNPEDSHHRTHRRENLKSYLVQSSLQWHYVHTKFH